MHFFGTSLNQLVAHRYVPAVATFTTMLDRRWLRIYDHISVLVVASHTYSERAFDWAYQPTDVSNHTFTFNPNLGYAPILQVFYDKKMNSLSITHN